jgi:phage tail-like protein
MNNFIINPGIDTGRIAPRRIDAPENTYVLSLGTDSIQTGFFTAGDKIRFSQDIDRVSTNSLRMRVNLIGPIRMPLISDIGPFNLSNGDTLVIYEDKILLSVIFSEVDFEDISTATCLEVAKVLNRDLPGFKAKVLDNYIFLESGQTFRQSEIYVDGGTSAAVFNFHRLCWKFYVDVDSVEKTSRFIRPRDNRILFDTIISTTDLDIIDNYGLNLELIDLDGGSAGKIQELYIPGAYVDILEFASFTGLRLGNRDPEPGEITHRLDDIISLDILSDGDPIDLSTIEVYITIGDEPEELVLSNSIFEPNYLGTESSINSVNDCQINIKIDPIVSFPESTLIVIRVEAETDGNQVLNESLGTYSFTTEDISPPTIISVTAVDPLTLRIVFSEDVSDDSLNELLYTLTPIDVPAYTPTVISAIRYLPNAIEITLDDMATIGKTYLLSISKVIDIWGNDSDNLTAQFISFFPTTFSRRSLKLIEEIPDINRYDRDHIGDLRKIIESLQDTLDIFLYEIDKWTEILDIDYASENFVDVMLQDLGNPFTFELTLNEKRRLGRLLISIYKLKGTKIGIINTIRLFLGIDIEINSINVDEGWILGISELGIDTLLGSEDRRLLYSFEIVVPRILTESEMEKLLEIVDIMKPAHTHLIEVIQPEPPLVIDHVELGLSMLDFEWLLH